MRKKSLIFILPGLLLLMSNQIYASKVFSYKTYEISKSRGKSPTPLSDLTIDALPLNIAKTVSSPLEIYSQFDFIHCCYFNTHRNNIRARGPPLL